MRIWLMVPCVVPLALTGCLAGMHGTTAARSGPPATAVVATPPEDAALALALARFAQGVLQVGEEGPDSAAALRSFQQALEADSGNHELASRVAVSALHRQDLDTAISALEASWRHDPDDYRRTVDLAAIYQGAGRTNDAVRQYQAALDIHPAPAALYVTLGSILFRLDRDDEALSLLRTGYPLADNPRLLAMVLYEKARDFVAADAIPRAVACFELLHAWDDAHTSDIDLILAELYVLSGRADDAIAILQATIALPEAPAERYIALAATALRVRQPNVAKTTLDAARERFADTPRVQVNLGILYSELERFEDVINILEPIRSLDEDEPADSAPPTLRSEYFYLCLGAAYERTGQFEKAESVFTECLARFPDSHPVMNYLAYMWAEQDREREQALAYSLRSLELDPDNGAYTDTLGWIYFRMKRFDEALASVTRARELAGDDPEILLHLGDIHEALGQTTLAIEYWTLSAEKDPSPANRATRKLQEMREAEKAP